MFRSTMATAGRTARTAIGTAAEALVVTPGARLNAAVVTLAPGCLAMAVAADGRLLPFRPAPRSVRIVIALIDSQPALRRELQRRPGRLGADVVLALGNAVAYGLTQDASQLGIDALHRLLLLSEERADMAAWHRCEAELRASGIPERPVRRTRRPQPLPDGPVEEYAGQAAKGQLPGAAGVLAATRSPGRAAGTLMTAVPRAAAGPGRRE